MTAYQLEVSRKMWLEDRGRYWWLQADTLRNTGARVIVLGRRKYLRRAMSEATEKSRAVQ